MNASVLSRQSLIGVIDLKAGHAVHARGGLRRDYAPVDQFFARGQLGTLLAQPPVPAIGTSVDGSRPVNLLQQAGNSLQQATEAASTAFASSAASIPLDGSPTRLIDCYRAAGLTACYVADLDAIVHRRWQKETLWGLAASAGHRTELFLDVGIRGDESDVELEWLASFARYHPPLTVLVAGESATSPNVLAQLQTRFPSIRFAVSFDFHDGTWMSKSTTLAQWIDVCAAGRVRSAVALDVGAVGGGSIRRALDVTRSLRNQLPDLQLITGGGIRSTEDGRRLLDAGADRLLVASAFLQDPADERLPSV